MGFGSFLKKTVGLAAPIVGGVLGGPAGAAAGAAVTGFLGQEETNAANSAQAQRSMDYSNSQFERQMAFNSSQADINRNFQREMSNTSYQRGMQDMRKAGLNPILAYQQGGASSPAGSSASVTSPSGAQAVMNNSAAAAMDAYGRVTNSAIAHKKMSKELYKLDQEGRKINMDVSRSSAEVGKLASQEDLNTTIRKGEILRNEAQSIRNQALKTSLAGLRFQTRSLIDNPTRYEISRWSSALGNLLGGGNSALGYKKILTGGK